MESMESWLQKVERRGSFEFCLPQCYHRADILPGKPVLKNAVRSEGWQREIHNYQVGFSEFQ